MRIDPTLQLQAVTCSPTPGRKGQGRRGQGSLQESEAHAVRLHKHSRPSPSHRTNQHQPQHLFKNQTSQSASLPGTAVPSGSHQAGTQLQRPPPPPPSPRRPQTRLSCRACLPMSPSEKTPPVIGTPAARCPRGSTDLTTTTMTTKPRNPMLLRWGKKVFLPLPLPLSLVTCASRKTGCRGWERERAREGERRKTQAERKTSRAAAAAATAASRSPSSAASACRCPWTRPSTPNCCGKVRHHETKRERSEARVRAVKSTEGTMG